MAVTLQEILQTSCAAYTEAHPVPSRVWKAAPAVRRCRRAALGGHGRQCPQGHGTESWYNSCRHRACPQCCGHRINQWLDSWREQLLPTDHFHVIFPLPRELPELWQWNRAPRTEVLFRSVRETLALLLGDPQWLGAQPGRLAALHPWGRTLTLHPHSHCLVSGGGLTGDGQWHAVRNGFLLPVAGVRRVFRGQVLGAIAALWTRGQLQGPPALGAAGVRRVLVAAARQKWKIRIVERDPHGRGVLKYLARYGRGGPIKDSRFVRFDGKRVTFRYGNQRDLDEASPPRQAELPLEVDEFLRRWSEHVPLPGVHLVRAWGLYASTQRPQLAQGRTQRPQPEPPREKARKTPERSPDDHPGNTVRCATNPWWESKCAPALAHRRAWRPGPWRPEGTAQIPIGRGVVAACPTPVGADTGQEGGLPNRSHRLARCSSTALR